MIYLGADHNGFKLKEKIKEYFEERSIGYADLGAHEPDARDDYVDYASLVSKMVAAEKGARGILVCGSGNGMAIAANKIKGARAAVAWNKISAKSASEEDHANILSLGASHTRKRSAIKIIEAYLAAKPSRASRHARRINKIMELEK